MPDYPPSSRSGSPEQSEGLLVQRRRVLLSVAGLVLTAAGCAEAPKHNASRRGAAAPMQRPSVLQGESHQTPLPVVPVSERSAAPSTPASPPPGQPEYYVHAGPKAIALTIDDGPDPRYTPQVLKLLHKYGITATFCMVGSNVQTHPALVREVVAQGHHIANHTWTHPDLVNMRHAAVLDQIERTTGAIHTATHGYLPTIFRAPYGAWSSDTLAICKRLKLLALDWSVDPRDWSRPGVSSIVNNVMANTRTGSIILEHDGGGDRSQTVAALRIFLPRLLAKGYHFVTP